MYLRIINSKDKKSLSDRRVSPVSVNLWDLQSWPMKSLRHMTKLQLLTHYFEVESYYSIFRSPTPLSPKKKYYSSSILHDSTSKLSGVLGGRGGQKDHMSCQSAKCPRNFDQDCRKI